MNLTFHFIILLIICILPIILSLPFRHLGNIPNKNILLRQNIQQNWTFSSKLVNIIKN